LKGKDFRLLAAKGPRAARKLINDALAAESKK
jgi:hypothetical protein